MNKILYEKLPKLTKHAVTEIFATRKYVAYIVIGDENYYVASYMQFPMEVSKWIDLLKAFSMYSDEIHNELFTLTFI